MLLTALLCVPAFAAGEHEHSGVLALSDEHAWGEWYTAKEPTVNEEGELRRVCANDPNHVQTQPIPKLDPPAQEEPSGGRTPFLDFWQRLINWFRKLFAAIADWFVR